MAQDPVAHEVASPPLARTLAAEAVGTTLLAALVIGSGIAAQQLSPADTGLQLAYNAAATAAGLYTIILMVGPVSGAHLNPVVSAADAILGGLAWRQMAAYVPVQVAGCVAGAALANLMFARAAVSFSTTHRASASHLLAEVVATAGLVLLIVSLTRSGRGNRVPAAVGAYIGAAYWFTSSTSFANPAITLGRMFSDSFAGIAPASAPAFIAAQLAGGGTGLLLARLLYPTAVLTGVPATASVSTPQAAPVVVPEAAPVAIPAPPSVSPPAPIPTTVVALPEPPAGIPNRTVEHHHTRGKTAGKEGVS